MMSFGDNREFEDYTRAPEISFQYYQLNFIIKNPQPKLLALIVGLTF